VDSLLPELKKEVAAPINYAHLMADVSKLFFVDLLKTANKLPHPSQEK
jgi:hypothetical protein